MVKVKIYILLQIQYLENLLPTKVFIRDFFKYWTLAKVFETFHLQKFLPAKCDGTAEVTSFKVMLCYH